MAAGGQALDIAVAISIIFSAVVLLLSKSPFRITGNRHQPAHDHHHHDPAGTAPNGGGGAGMLQAQSARPIQDGPSRIDYITIRTSQPEPARPTIEAFLDRAAKRWRLDSATRETDGGATTLHYAVRWRKRTPRDLLLEELRTLARSQGFTVEAMPAAVPEHPPGAMQAPPAS